MKYIKQNKRAISAVIDMIQILHPNEDCDTIFKECLVNRAICEVNREEYRRGIDSSWEGDLEVYGEEEVEQEIKKPNKPKKVTKKKMGKPKMKDKKEKVIKIDEKLEDLETVEEDWVDELE